MKDVTAGVAKRSSQKRCAAVARDSAKRAVSPWEPLHGWRRPNRSSCDYRHIVQNGRLVGIRGLDEPYTRRGPVWPKLLAWLGA